MYHINQFLKTFVFKGSSEAVHMDSGNPNILECPTQPSFPGDATCFKKQESGQGSQLSVSLCAIAQDRGITVCYSIQCSNYIVNRQDIKK